MEEICSHLGEEPKKEERNIHENTKVRKPQPSPELRSVWDVVDND